MNKFNECTTNKYDHYRSISCFRFASKRAWTLSLPSQFKSVSAFDALCTLFIWLHVVVTIRISLSLSLSFSSSVCVFTFLYIFIANQKPPLHHRILSICTEPHHTPHLPLICLCTFSLSHFFSFRDRTYCFCCFCYYCPFLLNIREPKQNSTTANTTLASVAITFQVTLQRMVGFCLNSFAAKTFKRLIFCGSFCSIKFTAHKFPLFFSL